jgi:glycosyltransferase involved in cell wall biosynthesis
VVGGRFVGFDIARALARRGKLAGIVTAYPRALSEGIAPALLKWNPIHGFREALMRRLQRGSTERHDYHYAVQFGRWAARHVPEAEVLQAWTGYALEPMEAARRKGATTIALRGSAHIRTQVELVREEFASFGLQPPRGHDAIIERECAEYDSADMVNVISTFAKRTFVERGFAPSRLIVTPLAVDIPRVAGDARRMPRRGPLRVLFLGHVSLRKGVHYLLEATNALGPSAVSVSLVGGTSADGDVLLRRLARSGEWKGPVARERLRQVFADHDVLVLPSVEDGFGSVICEAMAAGLPVIATENTGAPDVVRDGVDGLIVPARSSTALRTALEQLLAHPERVIDMGVSAAAAMTRLGTWDQFAGDMLEQYGRARASRTAAK